MTSFSFSHVLWRLICFGLIFILSLRSSALYDGDPTSLGALSLGEMRRTFQSADYVRLLFKAGIR